MFQLKRSYPHLQTFLAIGGWVWSVNFSDVASTPQGRDSLAKSCVKLMVDYGFDGIDVDWEFPGSATTKVGPPGMIFRDNDGDNMVALLSRFRTELDTYSAQSKKPYMLTLDIAPVQWYLTNTQIRVLSNGILDWFNIMHYEFALNGMPTTRHSSQLFNNPSDPVYQQNPRRYLSVDNSIKMFLDAGVSPDKLVIGVPAYGRVYQRVQAGNSYGLFQRFTGSSGGLKNYSDILKDIQSGKSKVYFDTIAKASYTYDDDGTFVTFEDVRSMEAKTDYINSNKLGGIMIWDIAKDVNNGFSLAQVAATKLNNTSFSKHDNVYEPLSPFCNINGSYKPSKNDSRTIQTQLGNALLLVILTLYMIFA
jgi:chitinase